MSFYKISKNKKLCFFLMSQGSFSPKIRVIGEKMFSVACSQTDTKVKTEDTLSGFQDFFQIFHQPIIKERSNKRLSHYEKYYSRSKIKYSQLCIHVFRNVYQFAVWRYACFFNFFCQLRECFVLEI